MLCSIKKKRGSVKFYLNKLPTDIIKIINIHSTYKYHIRNNKKLVKQIKKSVPHKYEFNYPHGDDGYQETSQAITNQLNADNYFNAQEVGIVYFLTRMAAFQ